MLQNQMNIKIFNFLLLFNLINLTILPKSLSTPIAESQPSSRRSPAKFKQPQPPPDAPKAGRGQGGASRGECNRIDSPAKIAITPLLPTNGWGLTVSQSPTLWVYVAYSGDRSQSETPLKAELSVEDRQTDTKLEPKSYPVELPKTSGIFSIALPHTIELEQWYRWYLVTNCQTATSSIGDVVQIEGFLQRKELNNSTHNLEELSPTERVSSYIEKRIWYDAFDEAVLLHCNNQSDNESKNYWQTLLKSDAVNLETISDRPVFCTN